MAKFNLQSLVRLVAASVRCNVTGTESKDVAMEHSLAIHSLPLHARTALPTDAMRPHRGQSATAMAAIRAGRLAGSTGVRYRRALAYQAGARFPGFVRTSRFMCWSPTASATLSPRVVTGKQSPAGSPARLKRG